MRPGQVADIGTALHAIESALPAQWSAAPQCLPEDCNWDAATPLQKLVLTKVYGRSAERAAIRAAAEARNATGLGWMALTCAIWPDNGLRRAIVARIQYWHRGG